jgi:4-hydroxy-3-polyprenylbenzoate decarboxylase
MLTAHEAGAILCPPMPSFYTHPKDLDDIALTFAARLCDLLGIAVASVNINRWQGL